MGRDEHEYLAYRLELALERRPIFSWTALQHRLCEVGSRRMDPRWVHQNLSVVALETGVMAETENGLYVRPLVDQPTLQIDAASHLERLNELGLDHDGRPRNSGDSLATMARILAEDLRGKGRIVQTQDVSESIDTLPTISQPDSRVVTAHRLFSSGVSRVMLPTKIGFRRRISSKLFSLSSEAFRSSSARTKS